MKGDAQVIGCLQVQLKNELITASNPIGTCGYSYHF